MPSRLGKWDKLPSLTQRGFTLCCMVKQVQTVCQHQWYRKEKFAMKVERFAFQCSQSISENSKRESASFY